jgi:hypothetical protein
MLAIFLSFLFSSVSALSNLTRDGVPAKYNTGWTFNDSGIDSLATFLTSSGPYSTQRGNMMGLGFLELAIKDIVLPAYSNTTIGSIDGSSFTWPKHPKILLKNGTGGTSCPEFQNNATWQIDLEPLYNYGCKSIKNGNKIPYINVTGAVNYWTNVHGVSNEFQVALKYYSEYHYYVARNVEEYFFGTNSVEGTLTYPVPLSNYHVGATGNITLDYVFNIAKMSTIRFSHALLQESVLQILLDNSANDVRQGYLHTTFDNWWRRDLAGYSNPDRATNEFPSNKTSSSDHLHYLISALDWLLSLRNPNTTNKFTSAPTCTNSPDTTQSTPRSSLAKDVLNLLATPVRQFGVRIDPSYKEDVKLQLYRSRELGLNTYAQHLSKLSLTTSNTDEVFVGAHKETVSANRYRNRIASLIMAAIVPVNNAIMVDPQSYWSVDSTGAWNGYIYHPNPAPGVPYLAEQHTYTFNWCQASSSQPCSATAYNAAAALFGYHPDMDSVENPDGTRSEGAIMSYPPDYLVYPMSDEDPNTKIFFIWRLLPQFINALYYKFDGLNSLAVKNAGADARYLPNQIVDEFPVNIGWNDAGFDAGDSGGNCAWWFKDPPMWTSSQCDRKSANAQGDGANCLWLGFTP